MQSHGTILWPTESTFSSNTRQSVVSSSGQKNVSIFSRDCEILYNPVVPTYSSTKILEWPCYIRLGHLIDVILHVNMIIAV